MVNQKFYQLGTAPSVIRELFAYGLEQAQVPLLVSQVHEVYQIIPYNFPPVVF